MKDLPIYKALERVAFVGLKPEFHLEHLFKFPEDRWFMPSNSGEYNYYQICSELHYLHIIEKKVTPVWRDGFFKGLTIYFRYSKNLKY